jgi:hypothetical protein
MGYKKFISSIFVALLLGLAGSALAVDTDWTSAGGDRLWGNAANWALGLPTAADKAAIRASIPGPIIDSATSAVASTVVLGDWSSVGDTLDMAGGSLTTGGWFIISYPAASDATLNVSGGAITVGSHLDVGYQGTGHMNMTAGAVTVNGAFGLGTNGGSGDVFLDGGTISCASFTMTSGSWLDVSGGALIVDGDATARINSYFGNGWITAYNGSGSLNVDYGETNPGKTTLTATLPTAPPAKAADPNPPDAATNVSTLPTLSWTPGTDAVSHDVYFGTTNPGTFQGNQTANTFNPGNLSQDTVYYWRIDEKNALGTTTGDVWRFTTTADSSYSLIGKVMAGYQGWFNAPGDGTTLGWVHWGGGDGTFSPDVCTVDMWPDMSEYSAGEKFLAGEFYDGTDHYVFSSHNQDTVNRHFKWMKDYGIDGVYLQRFANGLTPGSSRLNHKNDVLDYCKNAANLHGRKYAVMYDLSGLASGSDIQIVVNDWKSLVDDGKIPQAQSHDPAYIFHQGKPVVAVWGLGFGRVYEGQETRDLIDFLKNDPDYGGCTVMLGVDDDWRTYSDSFFQQTLQLADIVSPWMVGRYSNTSGVNTWAAAKGSLDKDWCDSNAKEYLPVIFPGFSWYNLKDGPFNQIPRQGGQFLWDQVKANISTVGARMLYVAMFDEVDEATAIFKVTNTPPNVSPAQFVTLDIDGYDLPSDEYLWLVGQAARGLRGEIPVNQTRPTRTTQAPGQAGDPGPADGATDVAINAELSWTAGYDADSHNVYFGTNPTPGAGELMGNQVSTSFDPGPLDYETTYYWSVEEINAVGTTRGPVWRFTTVPPGAPVDNHANGETTVSGNISGSYADTTAGDHVYEAITEVESGGKPSNRHSLLDHTWTIDIGPGGSPVLYVEAYHTANSEGDDFVFAYSSDNLNFAPAITVSKTSDDNTLQSRALPLALTGTVYIRVTDTDRTDGNRSLDTVYVDELYIETSAGGEPDTTAPAPDPMTWAVTPHATGSTSISMTAATADDVSGVEYLFTCTAGGGNDSGWQDSRTYEDTGLAPQTQYTYAVAARDKSVGQNATAASAPASATTDVAPQLPNAPSGLSATAADKTRIGLSWTDNAGDETSFKIERSTRNNSSFGQIATAGQDVTAYSDTTVRKGTTYYYRVRAANASGDSAYSAEANATTPK